MHQHCAWAETPGKGTAFTLYFPCVADDASPEIALPQEKQAPVQWKCTILLVEDEVEVGNVICAGLETSGYFVYRAASGEEAIGVANQHKGEIHLLLTDVILKHGLDGTTLAKRLRYAHPEMKVIYMTGYSDVLIRAGEGAGIDSPVMEKPFTFAALRRKIVETLSPKLAAANGDGSPN